MNNHHSFSLPTPAHALAWLTRNRIVLLGLVLVGLFGYTAYVVNSALNPQPTAAPQTSTPISFDKKAIEIVKGLQAVPVSVPANGSGKANPFSQ